MKVLLATLGTRGDVQPLLALRNELRRRGHEVVLAAGPEHAAWLEADGVDFVPAAPDANTRIDEMGALGGWRDFMRWYRDVAARDTPGIVERFRGLVADADVVVGTEYIAPLSSVAEALEVPYVMATYHPLGMEGVGTRERGRPGRLLERLESRIEQKLNKSMEMLATRGSTNRARLSLGLRPLPIGRVVEGECARTTRLIAFDERVAPVVRRRRAVLVASGFWFYDDPSPLDDEVQKFLNAGAPPIYFGFGSMVARPELGEIFLRTVEARGARAILAAGRGSFGRDLAARANILLCSRRLPHQRLFPRVAVVVHHGGAGTTASALRAGVPQVIVPHAFDQWYWGRRVRDLGVGPPALDGRHLAPQNLSVALDEALNTARSTRSELARHLSGNQGVGLAASFLEGAAVRGGRGRGRARA